MKKKFLSLCLMVSMVGSLMACGSKDTDTDTESAAASGDSSAELVMATNAEFQPYEYRDGEDIVGIDVEIAQAVAEDLGMTLRIEDMAFDSIIAAVNSGKADIGVAGMTVTEDRKMNVDFTDSYASSTQVIIVPEDSQIAGPDDLKGKIVGVQTGTTGDIYVTDDSSIEVERYAKGFEAVQALSQGKIDAVVIDREPAKAFVAQSQGIKILDESYTEEEYAIAVKKGNDELVNKINASLKKLKDSGKLQEIIDKYITSE